MSSKSKTPVAVTSRSFAKHPVLRAELLECYENVSFNQTGKILSGEDLVSFLRGHTKVISGLEIFDSVVLSQLPELKIISKYGVGLDMLDLRAMQKQGILLGWTPGVNRRSVAELTLVFALLLVHQAHIAHAELLEGKWKPRSGNLLTGKTVGIIGCGNVGKDLVQLLKPFGCKILVYDIVEYPEFYALHAIIPMDLETLLKKSDLVSLHIPLNETTTDFLNDKKLSFLKPSAYLINTSRGKIVDEVALKNQLKAGKLAGAAFDVFSIEPPEDPELIRLPNFYCTPHIGGSAEEAILAMGRAAIEGLDHAKNPESYEYCLK